MFVKNPYTAKKQNLIRAFDADRKNEELQRQLEEVTEQEHSWIQNKLEELGISLKGIKFQAEEVRDNKPKMSKTHQYKESLRLWKLARELVKETKKLKDEIRIRNTGGSK